MNANEIITVTSEIGRSLIEYGAEIYRAEESIKLIAASYGFSAEVFAIPSCLIITVDGESGVPITRQRRILVRGTNLDRVDKLNDLSRFICREKPNFHNIMKQLGHIKSRPVYNEKVIIASYAVIGATFALFFGGGVREAIASCLVAVMIGLISYAVSKIKPSVFFQNLICALFASSIAVIISKLGLTDGFDIVITGSLMTLVPGITLTNCMRDFIAGDFLAGLYTMTEAVLTALGMAAGTASAIALFA